MTTTQKENTNNWIKINGLWQQKIPLGSVEKTHQPIINVNISRGLRLEKIKKEQEDSRIRRCRRRNTELIAKIEKRNQEIIKRQKIEYVHHKKEVEYEREKMEEERVRVEQNKILKEEYEHYKTRVEDGYKKIKKLQEEERLRLEKIKIQSEDNWLISENLKLQDQEEIEWFDRKKKLQEEEEKLQVEKKQGFVYCFSNTHVEDLYKIGLTQKLTPDGRAKQLRGTGQIGKWQVEFAKKVRDCRKTEKVLHATFKKYHVDKEMFKVKDIDEIRKEFDLLQGEWYNPHNTQKITSHFNNL